MFKIGFCYVMDWEMREMPAQFARLKGMGYDGIELWSVNLEKLDIDWLADVFAESGLACAQICPYFDFVHGQEKWDETMRIAERYLDWARRLGKPLVRVFTGPGVGPSDATPEQWEATFAGLRRICDMAAPDGIRLAMECHGGSLMEDSPSTLRLIEGVGRDNLGVNLQLPLKNGHESVDTSIEQLGRYTWHMHAHNYTNVLEWELRTLGDGVLDYHSLLTRLIGHGFSGYVSIEHAHHEGKRDPWEVAGIEGAYLTGLRERLQAE